jgi:hypothetical protein
MDISSANESMISQAVIALLTSNQRNLEEVNALSKKFIVTIAALSNAPDSEPFYVSLFPSEGGATIVRGCAKTDAKLRQDWKDCCAGAVEKGLDDVLGRVAAEGFFTNEYSLTDDCAQRLGWFE